MNPEYSDMFENGIFRKRKAVGREVLPLQPPIKRIKKEPCDTYSISETKSSTEASGSGDGHSEFNWNSIFNQDIDVSGIRIKTEDIIDDSQESQRRQDSIDSGFASGKALSPTASDTNSDLALEDLLNADFMGDLDQPLDLMNGGGLDLTVTGSFIRPPEWWGESIGRSTELGDCDSGLNTPIAPSPVSDIENGRSHPWMETRPHNNDSSNNHFEDLDLHNLFDESDSSQCPF